MKHGAWVAFGLLFVATAIEGWGCFVTETTSYPDGVSRLGNGGGSSGSMASSGMGGHDGGTGPMCDDAGAPCPDGGVCDNTGSCVTCLEGTEKGCSAHELCYKSDGGLQCTDCANGKPVACGGICSSCIDDGGVGPCILCDQGGACTKDSDCKNNTCVDGVCCESICSQECRVCQALTGSCIDVETGMSDSPLCPDPDKVCVKQLGCLSHAGKSCVNPGDCLSNKCTAGSCDASPMGELCTVDADCIPNYTCPFNTHKCL